MERGQVFDIEWEKGINKYLFRTLEFIKFMYILCPPET